MSHQLRLAGMWLLQLQLLRSPCLRLGWGMWVFSGHLEEQEGAWSALAVAAVPASPWPGGQRGAPARCCCCCSSVLAALVWLLCLLGQSQCSLCRFNSVHSTFKTCQQQENVWFSPAFITFFFFLLFRLIMPVMLWLRIYTVACSPGSLPGSMRALRYCCFVLVKKSIEIL